LILQSQSTLEGDLLIEGSTSRTNCVARTTTFSGTLVQDQQNTLTSLSSNCGSLLVTLDTVDWAPEVTIAVDIPRPGTPGFPALALKYWDQATFTTLAPLINVKGKLSNIGGSIIFTLTNLGSTSISGSSFTIYIAWEYEEWS
jgi:hypothetical protein